MRITTPLPLSGLVIIMEVSSLRLLRMSISSSLKTGDAISDLSLLAELKQNLPKLRTLSRGSPISLPPRNSPLPAHSVITLHSLSIPNSCLALFVL